LNGEFARRDEDKDFDFAAGMANAAVLPLPVAD
jgi:hypothetical protein